MSDLTWGLRSTSNPYSATVPKTADTSTLIRRGVIHLGSFGAIGHAEFDTANSQIPFEGGLPFELRRGVVTLDISLANAPLFSGLYDTTDNKLGSGLFSFDARDLGALLQERDINPMVAPPNMSVGAFIEEIVSTVPIVGDASDGLDIDTIASPTNQNGTPITMGTYYGTGKKNAHFFARPEPAWGLIQRIAKDCGYVSYMLPEGTFYFGPRNRGQASGGSLETVALTWSLSGASDFLHDGLSIHHHGSRNAAFIVVVNSSNKQGFAPITGTCAYINPQFASDASLVLGPSGVPGVAPLPKSAPNAGMYVGISVNDLVADYGQLPIYNHFLSGLDQAQANMRALGIAREVAAQEVVIAGKVLGDESLDVGQPLTISGTGDPLVDGEEFVVVHSTLNLNIEHGGFVCDFSAWKADELQVSGIEGVG